MDRREPDRAAGEEPSTADRAEGQRSGAAFAGAGGARRDGAPGGVLGVSGLPERIGPYAILSKLGEGGFGVVYLAEQSEPVRRRVALKVIKAGMDSARILARFDAERQALAMMDHPNIARVLDAGTTDIASGARPWFAMELVAGEPITSYCDRERLTIRDRLGLMATVCDAVQHAHTRGIIHRDLKPSNILVSINDRKEPVAKVIDFGIAKALHQRLTEQTLVTERGQIVGTPEYMSPEQAEMGPLDIDTRSDVYSLGVVLYELLAGVRPFDLRDAAIVEIARIIREVDPPRPSTRVWTLGERSGDVAQARRLETRSLAGQLQRELEWIPLKALRKDRRERYQSASEMAEDLRGFLEGRPLRAGPESAAYRVRKFVSRHRAAVAGGALVSGALLLGTVGTTAGLVWALRERDKASEAARAEALAKGEAEASAVRARLAAEEAEAAAGAEAIAKAEAQANAERARLSAEAATEAARVAEEEAERARAASALALAREAQAEASTRFLIEVLGLSDPSYGGARDMSVSDAVEVATGRLDRDGFGLDKRTEASVRLTIAAINENRGRYSEALEQAQLAEDRLDEAMAADGTTGGDDIDLARALATQGRLRYYLGASDAGAALMARSLEMRERLLGQHRDVLGSLNDLGMLRVQTGRVEEGEALLRRAMEMADGMGLSAEPPGFNARRSLGHVVGVLGRLRESRELLERALADAEAYWTGVEHPDVAGLLSDLSYTMQQMQDWGSAGDYLGRSIELRRRMYGGDHPDIASGLLGMGRIQTGLGAFEPAATSLTEALEMFERLVPGDSAGSASALQHRARVYLDVGRGDEAERDLARANAMFRRLYPANTAFHASGMNNLGYLRERLGRMEEAAEAYELAVVMYRGSPGQGGEHLGKCLANLSRLRLAGGRAEEAEALSREAVEVFRRVYGQEHVDIAESLAMRGRALWALGRAEEARVSMGEAVAIVGRLFSAGDGRRLRIEEWARELDTDG